MSSQGRFPFSFQPEEGQASEAEALRELGALERRIFDYDGYWGWKWAASERLSSRYVALPQHLADDLVRGHGQAVLRIPPAGGMPAYRALAYHHKFYLSENDFIAPLRVQELAIRARRASHNPFVEFLIDVERVTQALRARAIPLLEENPFGMLRSYVQWTAFDGYVRSNLRPADALDAASFMSLLMGPSCTAADEFQREVGYTSRRLDAALRAAELWRDVISGGRYVPSDRSTAPDIEAFLRDQGLSHQEARRIAFVIKPSAASRPGRPKKNPSGT